MRRIALLTLAFALTACTPVPSDHSPNPSSSASSAMSSATASATTSEKPGTNSTGLPLNVPPNFSVEILAKDLPGARVMVQDTFGNFWVSQPSQGTITQLEMQDGKVVRQNAVFRNLRNPHGLVLDPERSLMLFIAEEHRISRVPLYSDGPMETIYQLPAVGRHFTRTLGIGPDNRLYVSIGSTCDVCVEKDPRNGSILSMNQDGSDVKTIATGLRNAVFFTWSYVDGRMWATEMGRDFLGDDVPPDEINIIQEGKNYGWPYCFGKQVRDTRFDASKNFDCATTEPSHIDLPAHVAPLGIAFIPEEGWPESMWYDLFIAEHGSWNRSEKSGYSLVRVPLDSKGNPEGNSQDFISGWLENGNALGRPVDILIRPGGLMYLTDDKKGVVYKVQYQGNQ